jgi:2-phosphosulfolactate phosphatase
MLRGRNLAGMTSHRTQSYYQVRFDWGTEGARAIADGAHAVVWVDELGAEEVPELGAPVIAGALRSADAVATWSLERQAELGGRFVIAIVAAGVREPDGSLRFAVEDLLSAGAIIEAISDLGIDHTSPEAAAAAAAYGGLRQATRHLVTASVSARELGGVQLNLEPATQVERLR